MMFSVTVVSGQDGFTALQNEWEKLEQADPDCSPFNSWVWLFAWWQHYGGDNRLRILTLYKNDRLIGIAPLYIRTEIQLRLMPVHVLRFIGSGGDTSPDYLNVVTLPEWREQVVDCVVDYLLGMPGWQKLMLTDIATPSLLQQRLHTCFGKQSGFIKPGRQNTILHGEVPVSWQDYRMSLTRKQRKKINHRNNRLQRAGRVEFSVCETAEAVEQATHALVDLHRLRWLSKGEPGSFASAEYIAFHRRVIRDFFARKELWMVTLRLNDDIIGVQYIFHWNNSLLFFQSGFLPEHESLSPGHAMFTYVIEQAIERGIARIDMLKGNYHYKTLYARQERHTEEFIYVRPGVARVVENARQVAKVLLRKQPANV